MQSFVELVNKLSDTTGNIVDIGADTLKGFKVVQALFEKSKSAGDPDLELALSGLALEVAHAQIANAGLKTEIAVLREEALKVNDFRKELDRYSLNERVPGHFVYALDPNKAEGQPLHSICAPCVRDEQIMILQRKFEGIGGGDSLRCPRCNETFGKFDVG